MNQTEGVSFGERIVTSDEVNEAAYGVFSTIGLPIGNEAAFALRDKIAEELAECLDGDMLEPDDFAAVSADWPSGSGVISVYTADQVQQWVDMRLWQCDLGDAYEALIQSPGDETISPTTLIGRELAFVAYELAYAMATTAAEIRDEEEANA